MGVSLPNRAGMAVGALDPSNLHIKYVASNLCSLFYLPAPGVVVRSKDGGECDRRIDFFWLRCDVTILQTVQRPNSWTVRISFHAAAVVNVEVSRACCLCIRGGDKRKTESDDCDTEVMPDAYRH